MWIPLDAGMLDTGLLDTGCWTWGHASTRQVPERSRRHRGMEKDPGLLDTGCWTWGHAGNRQVPEWSRRHRGMERDPTVSELIFSTDHHGTSIITELLTGLLVVVMP